MRLSTQVKPISYLKAHTSEIIREVNTSHNPVVITHNGEAKAIVQDLESYEQTQESIALLKLMAQGKKSRDSGDSKTASKAFASIRNKIKARK